MKIIEYDTKYKEKTINLLIKVALKEFGFEKWEIWFKKFKNQYYKLNGGNCWICIDENDEVIGTISLRNIDNISGEVKTMYIEKEYRGTGIAQELMNTLTNFAKSHGYKRLQLDTYAQFNRAIKFYEKNQFQLEEKIEDRYIYSKILSQEKISVIVAIYNIEKYVEECIKSIIKQTYKNLQIILIDDGSTDKSGEICEKYANQDERIEVIHKKNSGLADTRNTGLRLAKGEYISFIDGDDYIFPTFYEDLYNLIKKYDADISECQFLRIKEENIKKAKEIINEYNNNIEIKQETCNNEKALELLYGTKLNPYVKKVVVWNKIYRKSILEGIEFPLGKLHEDEYTTYKILDRCKKIVSTNKVLHGYIQTNNSIMRREIKQKRIDDNLDAYIKCSEYFKKKNDINLEMKCRRRYLENCIELAGKVLKTDNKNKKEQIDIIQALFVENYEKYIEQIKSIYSTNREKRIIEEIIVKAYDSLKTTNECIGNYWSNLEIIINEE